MKKLILIFLASTSFAALPPLYQSVREIQTLASHPRLAELLGSSEMITSITRTEKGYQVLTHNYVMEVDIHYGGGDRQFCGPAQFQFDFFEPVDIKTGVVKRIPAN